MNQLPWAQTSHGDVCLQGGHITRWREPRGDVLFMSAKSRFEPGQAIRGGVPIIFPWFGDDPESLGRSAHGFARRMTWRLLDQTDTPDTSTCTLALEDDDATRVLWPHRFRLELRVTFAATLELALEIENTDGTPFRCEAALHSYFSVADIRRVTVRGLEDAPYADKVGGMRRQPPSGVPVSFAGEVDRVYPGNTSTCVIDDPAGGRTISVAKDGSRSTIVWNPWIDKTARMSDLAPDDWQRFVCVESGNVGDDALTLAPGARHTMHVRIASA